MDELIKQHDKLLEEMPEGQVHDKEACPLCNPEEDTTETDERGEMETYTQSDLDAAVNAAVAPLQSELSALREAGQREEIASQIDAVREEAAAEVAELKNKLDEAVLRADSAEAEMANLVAFLEKAQADAEAEALKAQVKEERAQALRDNTSFSDEYIEERIEDFAAMTEEVFAARLEDFKVLSAASKAESAVTEEVVVEESGLAVRNVREEQASAEVPFTARMTNLFATAEANQVNLSGIAGL